MGIIADLARGKAAFPGQETGRQLWDRTFATAKEDRKYPEPRPIPGGTYGRSALSSDAAFKRLLLAMRSMAPGGWSDDRYEESRHFVGINYVAIHRICTQLQQAEFQVYRKDPSSPEGKRPVAESDPPEGGRFCKPYDLVRLLEKPNEADTFGLQMYRWGQQQKLTGMALTWMVPNELGVPMELYCIPTAIAIPQPAINPDYPDGFYRIQPIYPYGPFSSYPTPTSAVGAPIPAQWMLRFLYPHPILRYDGYSPLTGLRLHMDELEQMDRSRWYKMFRSINPSAALQMDEVEGAQPWTDDQIERVVAMFENAHQGVQNHGSLLVAPPGGRLEEWGAQPKDMDYQAGWEQLTSFILGGGFGITKPAAGMIEDSSYASLFATLKQLHLVTLKPDCDAIAAQLTRRLAPFYGDDLIVDIRCPRIDDHDITFQKADKLMTAKAATKNEIRQLLDVPQTEEEWGNDIAGDPSAAEKEMQEQEQQAALANPVAGEEPPPEGALPGTENPTERDEPMEMTQDRPRPGPLGRGALGPRDAKRYRRVRVVQRLLRSKSITLPEARQLIHANGTNGKH